jgi:hypothetical protein
VFQSFIAMVTDAMELHAAPYHSVYHAADCAQSMLVYLTRFKADQFFSPVECFGLIVAALSHDLEHPGLSNGYQENAQVRSACCRLLRLEEAN